MMAYTSQWWVAELCNFQPDSMGHGDEYFSCKTVRKIVENWVDPIPDATGDPFDKWAMPRSKD